MLGATSCTKPRGKKRGTKLHTFLKPQRKNGRHAHTHTHTHTLTVRRNYASQCDHMVWRGGGRIPTLPPCLLLHHTEEVSVYSVQFKLCAITSCYIACARRVLNSRVRPRQLSLSAGPRTELWTDTLRLDFKSTRHTVDTSTQQ